MKQATTVPTTEINPVARLRAFAAHPVVRVVLLTLYYLLIILGLILLYGRGDFSTPPFIYVGY